MECEGERFMNARVKKISEKNEENLDEKNKSDEGK